MTFSIFRKRSGWHLPYGEGNWISLCLPSFFRDEVVKIVPQKVGTIHSSMAIEHSKISWFFPIAAVFRFCEVQDDGNSVLVVLANRSLISWSRIRSDSSMPVLRMLGRLKVGDWDQNFRQLRSAVLTSPDAPLFDIVELRLKIDLFSDDLVHHLCGGFWFRSGLVLVAILDCARLRQFQLLVRCVERFPLVVFFAVEKRSALLRVFRRGGFWKLDFRRRIGLQSHPCAKTGKDRRNLGRVLWRFGR